MDLLNDVTFRLLITIFSIVGAVWGQAWWLASKFQYVESVARNYCEANKDALLAHEKDMQKRFEQISVSLAKIGADLNGKH